MINSDRLVDCNIYVTLEPCIMCASAISKAKLKRLYYGADDLKYGSINGNLNFLYQKIAIICQKFMIIFQKLTVKT